MATKKSLNSLPAELKYMILDNIHDFDSLSSIVHASPKYHQIYLTSRRQILSQVVIRDLSCKSNSEVLPLSELFPYTKVPSDTTIGWTEMREALRAKAFQDKREGPPSMSKPEQHPGLNIDQCLALLRSRRVSASGCIEYKIFREFNGGEYGMLKNWNRADCTFIGGVEGLEEWLIRVYACEKYHLRAILRLGLQKPQYQFFERSSSLSSPVELNRFT